MASAALRDLLRELGDARGLRGRLRILARSFDLLRNLTPADRERVALEVGSDWAWKQVERTFMKDGRLSEGEQVIRQAFETLGSADPAELRQAARRIRQRDTEGLEQAAIQTLERILEEDGALSEDAGDADAAEAPDTLIEVALSNVATEEEADGIEQEAAPAEVPAASEAAPPGPAPTPFRLPNPGQPRSRPVPPDPPRPRAQDRPRPVRREATPPPPEPAVDFPTSRERLRALRSLRTPGHAERLGSETRRRWIEGLAGNWAGRRALSAMIKDQAITDVDEALALIALLARDSDKLWCLIDWIETQPVGDSERARVLDAAPTPMARRRLERRIA